MLRIAVPHVEAWNTWYSDTLNSPAGVAPLRDIVDAACRDVGRDPAEIARTVAVHVRLPDGSGRTMGGDSSTNERIRPLEGDPESMAAELRAYASAGITEVQLVLDPIDRPAIERFAAVLAILDRG
jgi:alkanesulfonate monooxygenase SsuD/methylene tetrahydromethanopterin reductase-like flavin-dependent oxidoreductase (luciferase family)